VLLRAELNHRDVVPAFDPYLGPSTVTPIQPLTLSLSLPLFLSLCVCAFSVLHSSQSECEWSYGLSVDRTHSSDKSALRERSGREKRGGMAEVEKERGRKRSKEKKNIRNRLGNYASAPSCLSSTSLLFPFQILSA
jgi:hypothetical protein